MCTSNGRYLLDVLACIASVLCQRNEASSWTWNGICDGMCLRPCTSLNPLFLQVKVLTVACEYCRAGMSHNSDCSVFHS